MMQETIGTSQLEAEYLSSCILKGILYPHSYTNLRIQLAGLKFIDISNKYDTKLLELQNQTIEKSGLLKDKEIESYYYGKNPELKSLIKSLSNEISKMDDLYSIAIPEKGIMIADELEGNISSAPFTYADIGEQVNRAATQHSHLEELNSTHLDVQRTKASLRNILDSYGLSNIKLPKKGFEASLSTDYQLYIQDLTMNLDKVTSNPQLTFTLSNCLDSVASLIPKDELDPYLSDVCNNFLEVVTNPKSFYSMCENDEIISSSVGQMFQHCYPSFYNKFLDMYMDAIPDMDYQDQIDFRKCFGMEADNAALSSLCSKYILLGFIQPQPQGK